MLKKVILRTTGSIRKKLKAAGVSYKVQFLATLLQNIYWNGFKDRRGTSYRINRSRLKDLAEVRRFEVGTLRRLVDRLKADGFILCPLDKTDLGANEWVFDKRDKLRALPLADDVAIRNAEDRADDVD
jgi:hypothetical protein